MIVVARYNEDVSWVRGEHFIVQKDTHLPNTGREATSYLWWIIENYKRLPGGMTTFVQGGALEHCPALYHWLNILQPVDFAWAPGPLWETDRKRALQFPDEAPLPLVELWHDLTGKDFHGCQYVPWAQFAVSKETMLRKPLADYEKALELLMTKYAERPGLRYDENEYIARGPWAMERLWARWFLC